LGNSDDHEMSLRNDKSPEDTLEVSFRTDDHNMIHPYHLLDQDLRVFEGNPHPFSAGELSPINTSMANEFHCLAKEVNHHNTVFAEGFSELLDKRKVNGRWTINISKSNEAVSLS